MFSFLLKNDILTKVYFSW